MVESQFQSKLIKKLKQRYPGCMVLKNDPNYIQGIPDLIVLNKHKWAALEVKKSSNAKHRPNQDYYVSKMSDLSYASFISPENEETVLKELDEVFGSFE